jgi:trans-2-enoyl-CoA reductase
MQSIKQTAAMMYSSYGKPATVLQCRTLQLDKRKQLLLKMLAAPINPADLNQIQGTYPIRPNIPHAIGGNEGVAVVIESSDTSIPVGTRVLPQRASFG